MVRICSRAVAALLVAVAGCATTPAAAPGGGARLIGQRFACRSEANIWHAAVARHDDPAAGVREADELVRVYRERGGCRGADARMQAWGKPVPHVPRCLPRRPGGSCER